jgi:hypothetical protein
MRANTMMVTMSVVIFKISPFRRSANECMSRHHLNSNEFPEVNIHSCYRVVV